jgi:hypothetical protein
MASTVKSNLRQSGIDIQEGFGSPTHKAAKGTLYIRTDATTTTTRLWINTDGGVTWAYFTSSA